MLPEAQKRRHHARQRNRAQHAARNQQHLKRDQRRQTEREKHPVFARGAQSDAQSRATPEIRATEAPRRRRKIPTLRRSPAAPGPYCPAGIMSGSPHPGPDPQRAAGRKRPQRMRQLIAAVHVVVPWREPHVDALHHGGRFAQVISDSHAADQQHDAEHGQSGASARDGEHREKQKSGDQRRAEILQQEEQAQRAARPRTSPAEHAKGAAIRSSAERGNSRFSRKSRSRSQLRAKYPARKNTSRILIASTGWNGPRFTLASLPPGPIRIAAVRRTAPSAPNSGV